MSSTEQKPRTKQIISQQTRSPTKQQSRELNLEETVETLKTKLALTEQAQAVKLAQQQLRSGKQISPWELGVRQNSQLDGSRSGQTAVSGEKPLDTPISTAYVPRIATVERIVKSPYPQLTQTLPSSPPIIANPQTQPLVNVIPQATPNPLQDWAMFLISAQLDEYIRQTTANLIDSFGMDALAVLARDKFAQNLLIRRDRLSLVISYSRY